MSYYGCEGCGTQWVFHDQGSIQRVTIEREGDIKPTGRMFRVYHEFEPIDKFTFKPGQGTIIKCPFCLDIEEVKRKFHAHPGRAYES